MRLCFLVGLALSLGSVAAFGQSSPRGGKSASGTELTAEKIDQADKAGTRVFIYSLKARGYPPGAKVGFWRQI